MSVSTSQRRPFNSVRPRILDLFCCEGGAGAGYARAGFEVVGLDVKPQPRYPFEFHQAEALESFERLVRGEVRFGYGIGEFAAVHASPPCQAYSKTWRIQANEHQDLIGEVRRLAVQAGLPYVIENVPGAPLEDPIELCGTMVGLRLYRHRQFETNWPLSQPLHSQHFLKQVKMGRKAGPGEILQVVGNFSGVEQAREVMEMPWASRDGLREAIPPAYCEFIGRELGAYMVRKELAA